MLPLVSLAALSFSAPVMRAPSTSAVRMSASTVDTSAKLAEDRALSYRIESSPLFLDEAKLLSDQAFPFSEAMLISKTKEFLYFEQGIQQPDMLADDMVRRTSHSMSPRCHAYLSVASAHTHRLTSRAQVFMGPFVGGASGLPKEGFLSAVGGFNIKSAFPDISPGFHHFRADPLDPGRVWFTSTASGTDTGGFLGNEPTGKRFETPPQACSVKWNAEGKVTKYTIGHVMERSIGNTGGLGGIFGPAYAIGKGLPFPEARPWKPSKRYRALMMLAKVGSWFKSRQQKK